MEKLIYVLWRDPRGEAVDHILGKRWALRDYLRGEWE